MATSCPFCEILQGATNPRIIFERAEFVAIWDGFPVSKGHALLVSKRHAGSFFDLSIEERCDALESISKLKDLIDGKFSPGAYNIGINEGAEAGQTVPHVHIHVIPRYKGDVVDPRGGIRWVVPDKADYWSQKQ